MFHPLFVCLTLVNIQVEYLVRKLTEKILMVFLCSSTKELLCVNADYLVNAISARMRHIQRNPSTPGVLQVILTYSGKEILPLVNDTANEVCNPLHNMI